uniref:4-hydroxy-4-methyl-2-oxoglutarate aldolase n=1 Tax=Amphora coffeiformis TaxID=265554 RepID=A0A7S3P6D2_9STRA|mmetsp:Transcript_13412/g.25683  ORF Transcript_13412/g.25683 Transcript_13412/m.25683 type:complete len:239 (-) Transcript_13412:61-777(-)
MRRALLSFPKRLLKFCSSPTIAPRARTAGYFRQPQHRRLLVSSCFRPMTTTPASLATADHHHHDRSLLSQATADLYDLFLDNARVPIDIAWQSYGQLSHFSGSVCTIRCFEDNSRIKECAESPGHGRVMVVDAGGSRRCAVLGDMIAEMARDNGWQGIIVYGCVRDVAFLRTLENFGVMALGSIPRKSTRRGEGQTDLTIRVGNVEVNTGDFVVADADGILFLSKEQVERKKGSSSSS